MPTIRVDEEVFKGLQELGETFVDSPNDVIRRLLVEKDVIGENSAKRTRRRRRKKAGELTPQPLYAQYLLYVLCEFFEGEGSKPDVTEKVISLMEEQGLLKPADFETVSTGESKAENSIAWARNMLKDQGDISAESRRGRWKLTPRGRSKAEKLLLDELKAQILARLDSTAKA